MSSCFPLSYFRKLLGFGKKKVAVKSAGVLTQALWASAAGRMYSTQVGWPHARRADAARGAVTEQHAPRTARSVWRAWSWGRVLFQFRMCRPCAHTWFSFIPPPPLPRIFETGVSYTQIWSHTTYLISPNRLCFSVRKLCRLNYYYYYFSFWEKVGRRGSWEREREKSLSRFSA